jgi:hypothetical protein
MPRPRRVEFAGAIYHLMSRGDHREAIFRDEEDRQTFFRALGEAGEKTGWQVHACCLLGNHFHLVTETPQPNLVAGMKWFLGPAPDPPARLASRGVVGSGIGSSREGPSAQSCPRTPASARNPDDAGLDCQAVAHRQRQLRFVPAEEAAVVIEGRTDAEAVIVDCENRPFPTKGGCRTAGPAGAPFVSSVPGDACAQRSHAHHAGSGCMIR